MQAFWFGVIAVLWAGFFVLEGFDFGVGTLLPVVAKTDEERQIALRSIGPVWDGNEVWLLTAGGATFAAFPHWYASMFSGFYLAFALLLVGLILRGIGIEYRGKAHTAQGRKWCDFAIVAGSFIPSLLLGVAFANIMRGVNIAPGAGGAHAANTATMTNSFFSLLNPYALLGGIVTLTLFLFHGAVYLVLRTTGEVHDVAKSLITVLAPVTAVAAVAFLGWTATIRGGWVSMALAVVIALTFVLSAMWGIKGREGWSFTGSAIVALLVPIWVFAVLWPDVLPARNNSALSLTVHNASSSPMTLKLMTIVALVMTPIVLAYQAWSYWVFRARVTGADISGGDLYGGGVIAQTIEKAKHSAQQVLGTEGGEKPQPAGSGTPSPS